MTLTKVHDLGQADHDLNRSVPSTVGWADHDLSDVYANLCIFGFPPQPLIGWALFLSFGRVRSPSLPDAAVLCCTILLGGS